MPDRAIPDVTESEAPGAGAPAATAESDAEPDGGDGRPHGLEAVLKRVRAVAEGERTEVGAMVASLGHASFTPVLLLPALIVVSPLSGIPILPSVCGLTIALIALQMLFGRTHLWLPRWLLGRQIPTSRLVQALDWMQRPAGWVDAITAPRLQHLVTPPVSWALLAACALAGAAMPVLELLPFTSSILAAAISLMAVGLLVRDGLVALAGLGFIGLALAAILLLL